MHRLHAKVAAARLRIACERDMILQGKHARTTSDSPQEKQAKQHRPYESPSESPHFKPNEDGEFQPSQREIAAANAARERLYGRPTKALEEVAETRLPTGTEPSAVPEVEYTPRAELQPVENADADLTPALEKCRSSDWSTTCAGLLVVRRIALHDKDVAWQHMKEIMPLVIKSVRSLRSSVSKTAIMAAADLVESFGDELLPHLDLGGPNKPASSLLNQLLLKGSSNDKRFVIDEVQRTLNISACHISPTPFLQLLLPYASHKNPKVRGTTATTIAAAAQRMQSENWEETGIARMLKLAGTLISDNTPEARAAAKKLAGLVHAAYKQQAEEKENARAKGTHVNSPRNCNPTGKEAGATPLAASWEDQCKECLGPAQANSILKVTEQD